MRIAKSWYSLARAIVLKQPKSKEERQMNRYDATGDEAEFQPHSDAGILRNSLGLTKKQDIDDAETELLAALYQNVFSKNVHKLAFNDIKNWHRQWLGNLYSWAGKLRTVNMSKGDFHFAIAGQLPVLINKFERDYLQKFPDLPEMPDEDLAQYMAESHVEFILIHPFREGNGRISRLLLDLMAQQAGFHPLDYQLWEQHKDYYFKAIQAGAAGDYRHVERLVREVLIQQIDG